MQGYRHRRGKLLTGIWIGLVLILILSGGWELGFEWRAQGPARLATELARNSARIQQVLGNPIIGSRFIRGSLIADGGNGNADLYFQIKGPLGQGTLNEWAQQGAGKWHICGLTFKPDPRRSELVLVDEAYTHCERE